MILHKTENPVIYSSGNHVTRISHYEISRAVVSVTAMPCRFSVGSLSLLDTVQTTSRHCKGIELMLRQGIIIVILLLLFLLGDVPLLFLC